MASLVAWILKGQNDSNWFSGLQEYEVQSSSNRKMLISPLGVQLGRCFII